MSKVYGGQEQPISTGRAQADVYGVNYQGDEFVSIDDSGCAHTYMITDVGRIIVYGTVAC